MRYLLATALIVMLTLPVATQDLQKGYVAYQRGDYATALLEWRPLAEQGNAENSLVRFILHQKKEPD
jgi:hypothetical protein